MNQIQMRKFSSIRDFISRLFGLLKGATLGMTLLKTPPKLREKILITVSMANNCMG